MLMLHFGDVREVDGRTIGTFALHVQCPWRLEGPSGIVTGYSDLLQQNDATLQLFEDLINDGVETAITDAYGGAIIGLHGGYRLSIFPASAHSEHWRLFQPATQQLHFVVEDKRCLWE